MRRLALLAALAILLAAPASGANRCMGTVSGREFADTDCDGVKDAGELYVDEIDTAAIDTCSEFAAIMGSETGTCGALVFSADPALTGNPTVPTASTGDNDTTVSSTGFVRQEINAAGGRSITCASGSCDNDVEVYEKTKCINVDPTNSTTDWLFFRAERAITITGIDCIVDAATSVVMTLRECNSNAASCGDTEAAITCGTTNTTEATSVDDSAVDAGDWMRVTRGTRTGSPLQAILCATYTVND